MFKILKIISNFFYQMKDIGTLRICQTFLIYIHQHIHPANRIMSGLITRQDGTNGHIKADLSYLPEYTKTIPVRIPHQQSQS